MKRYLDKHGVYYWKKEEKVEVKEESVEPSKQTKKLTKKGRK